MHHTLVVKYSKTTLNWKQTRLAEFCRQNTSLAGAVKPRVAHPIIRTSILSTDYPELTVIHNRSTNIVIVLLEYIIYF